MPIENDQCPKCGGEITFGFGLAGGGVKENGETVPGVYFMCFDCDWMSPESQETICFPHGIVPEKTEV